MLKLKNQTYVGFVAPKYHLTLMAARKSSNLQGAIAGGTFEVVGEEWFDLKMLDKSKEHTERAKIMLKNDPYPVCGML